MTWSKSGLTSCSTGQYLTLEKSNSSLSKSIFTMTDGPTGTVDTWQSWILSSMWWAEGRRWYKKIKTESRATGTQQISINCGQCQGTSWGSRSSEERLTTRTQTIGWATKRIRWTIFTNTSIRRSTRKVCLDRFLSKLSFSVGTWDWWTSWWQTFTNIITVIFQWADWRKSFTRSQCWGRCWYTDTLTNWSICWSTTAMWQAATSTSCSLRLWTKFGSDWSFWIIYFEPHSIIYTWNKDRSMTDMIRIEKIISEWWLVNKWEVDYKVISDSKVQSLAVIVLSHFYSYKWSEDSWS